MSKEAVPQIVETVTISPPKFQRIEISIKGTAPYMQARFSEKAANAMREKMEAGSTAKGKKVRAARDFEDDFKQAMHVSKEGWIGIPASAFRNASISACRIVGFKMTLAKLSLFIEADGYDRLDETPLVRIYGDPQPCELPVRNATGVLDLRVRPMWPEWTAKVRMRYDADQFTANDVANLIMRVGMQVGIGEGRPDSKASAGIGFGTFEVC